MSDKEKIKAAKAYLLKIIGYNRKIGVLHRNLRWCNSHSGNNAHELQKEIDELVARRQTIIDRIMSLDGDCSRVLYLRYAEGNNIPQTSIKVYSSERQLFRLQRQGLLEIYDRYLADGEADD